MPRRLPLTRVVDTKDPRSQAPLRTKRSARQTPRATSISRPKAASATQSLSTSGV